MINGTIPALVHASLCCTVSHVSWGHLQDRSSSSPTLFSHRSPCTHTHTQRPLPTYQQISLTEPRARLRTSKLTEATLARISSPICGQICVKTNTRPINTRSNVHSGRSKQSQCRGGEKNRKKKQLSIERRLAATQGDDGVARPICRRETRGRFCTIIAI